MVKYELLIPLYGMNSPQNNILYQLFSSPRSVFTIPTIGMLVGETREGVLAKHLNYYVHQGMFLNPRRGVYTKKDYNPEELANILYTPSYLSLEYVLQKVGVVFQYDSTFTSVCYLCRSIEIDGHTFCYRRIKPELLADTRGIIIKDNVSIATPERAFLDTIYLNREYFFDNLHPLSYEKILTLLPLYKNQSMVTRVQRFFKK